MALPATKALVVMKDTSSRRPDHQGHRLPVEVGLRLPEGRGRGHRLPVHARRGAARDVRRRRQAPKADDYLLKVDNPLVVPVNKKVRIITTANDVIHAWGVPAFGVKQDAIPGFVRDTWFRAEKTGDYYGQCVRAVRQGARLHADHVKVVSAEDYSAWVDGKKKKMAAPRQDDPNKVWTLDDLEAARREGLRRQLRRLPPGQRQGRPARSRRWSARRSCSTRTRPKQIHIVLNGQEQRRDAGLEAAVGHRHRRRHHLHQEQLVQQDRPASCSRPKCWRRAASRCGHRMTRTDDQGSTADERSHTTTRTATTTTTHHAPARLAALGLRDQPQGHRHDVPVFAFTMFMVGGVLALLIRAELFQPGLQFVNPELFNQLTTMHGLIMVFGAIMPAFVGFANWMIPLQIGAPDMAFARMNNLSFWLLPRRRCCWSARSSCPAARPPPAGRCMRR